jgi:uncharacterized membrane protein
MSHTVQPVRIWTKVLGGIAAGAAAMYVLDPNAGKRRRAIARDRVRSVASDAGRVLRQAARDVGNRAAGLAAEAFRQVEPPRATDDDIVIARARAAMGRVVSHPHAICIHVHDGRLTVSGPILANEVPQLLEVLREVPGVTEVEDRLEAHERADGVSSLQGGSVRAQARSELMQENWAPSLRVGSVVAGGLLTLWALTQRGPIRLATGALAAALTARGVTNMPMRRLAGLQGRRAIELQETVHVDAAPERVYDLWVHGENFPHFMSHVEEVRTLGERRQHWVVRGPAGMRVQWDALITRAESPRLVSWRTEPGSTVQHAGSAQFEPFDHGTRVTVRMSYNAGGAIGHALATLLGANPKQQLDDDLARMKMFVEQGVRPRDAAAAH